MKPTGNILSYTTNISLYCKRKKKVASWDEQMTSTPQKEKTDSPSLRINVSI